jgi:hypothetical protein
MGGNIMHDLNILLDLRIRLGVEEYVFKENKPNVCR